MDKKSTLARLAKINGSLPETDTASKGDYTVFLVRKKPFAYFLDNHHGDGIVAIACKALPGDNARLVEAEPERFYLPKYIGPRGWVAMRLDFGKVDWEEASELMLGSYLLTAPKTLAARVQQSM